MKKFLLFVLAIATFATVGAASAQASSGYSTACKLNVGSGDILVNFGSRIYSDRDPRTVSYSASIPAGKYKVSLQSLDGYTNRALSNPNGQKNEQYFVDFRAGGSTVTKSGVTQDLQDSVDVATWQGVVNNSLTISRNVNQVIATHQVLNSTSPNSLTPICMVLKPITPPTTGVCNTALDGKTLQSKPSSNLCTSGSATVVSGDGSQANPWRWDCIGSNGGGNDWCKAYKSNDPVCGNGKIEAPEQCDDGNTKNGDGCSNSCHLENVPTSCPYNATGDQIIIDGYSKRLISTQGGTFQESKNQMVPAGDYKVELAAYDNYTNRPLTKVQPNETWKLVLRDGNGTIATSGSTQDLQDGVVFADWKGTVNNSLTVSRKATQAIARHAVYVDNSSANSVQPVCARLTPKPKPPVCGNGKVEKGETCDDGNTNNYDGCSNQCVPETPSIKIIKRDAVDKDDTQTVKKGETAKFQIIVRNDGKVNLKDVKVTDALEPACNKTIGNLAVGAQNVYTCDSTNVQADFTNVAKVIGTPVNGGSKVTDNDPTDVKVIIPGKPSISIDKDDADNSDDTQTVKKGETATFTIIVKNDGEVDLKDVKVTDAKAPSCDKNIGDLDKGETVKYTCTKTNVTAAFTNIADVEGTSKEDGTKVDDKDPTDVKVTVPGNPSIKIVKRDANDKDDIQKIKKGETANFEIIVTNNGDVDLTGVQVRDAKESACDEVIGDLAVGASKTYTCDSTDVQASFTNIAAVEGTSTEDGTKVTDEDPTDVEVEEPGEVSIKIVKRDGIDKDDTQTVKKGGTATFEIIVTNNGDVDLENVVVTDPKESSCNKNIGDLAKGESTTYTCTSTNVQGAFINIAEVEGESKEDGTKVADEDPTNVNTESTPQGPICGNGIIEEPEECDGGKDCNSRCEKEKEHDCDAKIGDRVWLDKNGNGVQDPNEPGMSNVKVKVIDGNDKKYDTTDANGNYKFKNLCGKVRVIVASETLPQGCWQTYDRDGKLDHSYKRDLDDDESYKKADFGYRCPGTTTRKRSPDTGAAGAATGTAAFLAAGAAWMNYRRQTRA